TISHERDLHLGRQLAALASLEDHGLESIVVLMDQPVVPASCDRPWVRVVHVDGRPLPLGEARNAGARAARGETVVFLDVDVIPEAGAVEQLVAEAEHGGVVMADPWYLPPSWDGRELPGGALPHPSRADLAVGRTDRYEMFWSLGFACRREVFDSVGGFDDSYAGYVAEDTDFAFTLRAAQVPLAFSSARVFHQAHAVIRPPLHHLDSIVVNARRFREKFGTWPMEGWLRA